MLISFTDFILEGRSINNDIKKISNELILILANEFDIIYNDYISNKTNVTPLSINNLNILCYQKSYNLFYNLNKYLDDIKIKDIEINLNIKISNHLKDVIDSTDANFNISSTYIIDDVIQVANFNFNLYLTEDLIQYKAIKKTGIITSIVHELTHLLEYYKIESKHKLLSKSYSRNLNLQNLKLTLTNYQYENFYDIIYRLYLCLDHEVNATSAELYNYLLYSNALKYEELVNLYKNSKIFSKINFLKNLNVETFIKNIKNIYSEEDILIIINIIIEELNVNHKDLGFKDDIKFKSIKTIIDFKLFIIKLNKLFVEKSEKYLEIYID